MTQYLALGDLALKYLYLTANELTPATEDRPNNFEKLVGLSYRHLVVSMTSGAFCLASTRADISTSLQGDALKVAKEEFLLATWPGYLCKCSEIHPDVNLQ